MSTIEVLVESFTFNRSRVLTLLDDIDQLENPAEALGWRPGEGRAHIAWQLMHLGISEEIFATEWLVASDESPHRESWSRFRGGSTPDDEIPSSGEIRTVLADGRQQLVDALAGYDDSQLDDTIWHHPRMKVDLSLLNILHIIGYHEGHHQGQAHITLNLYKASN
ncbi:MAG: DinB family protein [Pirellulaceae bacterium]